MHLYYRESGFWQLDYREQDGTTDWYDGGYKAYATGDLWADLGGRVEWSTGAFVTFEQRIPPASA